MQPQPKAVKIGEEARRLVLEGVETVYLAVSETLGPRSGNVAIKRPFGRPAVVHDGVTVAKEILPLDNDFQNVGAELAVEAADKTNNAGGDGTTTATILMRNIARNANRAIVAGGKPMALREGIEAATQAVADFLIGSASPISSVADVQRIATISAQNEQIGKMVADAYKELGKDGIMSVEESRSTETYLELKTGMEFDRGYRSPYFVNDQVLGEATVNSPFILVTDYQLHSAIGINGLAPVLEKLVGEGVKDIVVIADDIDGEALAFLAVNHVKGNIRALAVNAPSFGDKRTDILRDIATVTGATFISKDGGIGFSPESISKAMLGQATRVSSTKDTTLIIDGKGAQEDIDTRAELIKSQADSPDTGEFDREKLMERYAKIKSGVAVLTIGAKSEPEIKERKERAIDAISAAKAALADGVVPGGGMSLIAAADHVAATLTSDNPDFAAGIRIVLDACRQPFRKLMENSGFDPGERLAAIKKPGQGVNVMTGEVVDMLKEGIIDPVLVVKSALEYASSNGVMVATSNVVIVEKPLKQKEQL